MLQFLGIGAQKAATTWTYVNLARHPQVRFPGGKEVHFWDNRAGRPASAWLGLFADPVPEVFEGEITPAYALLDVESVREIQRSRPQLRLFYNLRSPAQRAWSSALMALRRAELEPDEVSDQWFIDHFRSRGSRRRGDYALCIERWRSVFGRNALALVFHEDVLARPLEVLKELAKHIGIDADFYDGVPEADLRQPQGAGVDIPLRPSLIPVLRDIYVDGITKVESLCSRSLGHWRSELGD